MKTLILSLLLICNVMAITAKDAAWVLNAQTDLHKALKQAKQENKDMVLLLVVKDGCEWCEKMVHETMQNRNIKDALSDAIIVIIDSKSDLAKKYKTTLTPSVFFIDAKTEKSVYTQVGYEKAGSFLISIISAKDNIGQE